MSDVGSPIYSCSIAMYVQKFLRMCTYYLAHELAYHILLIISNVLQQAKLCHDMDWPMKSYWY